MQKQYYLLICAAIVGVVLWLQPPRYNSFADAVAADLRQQGLATSRIELVHAWPDTVNTISYGANLRVTLLSGRVVWGRLECQQQTQNCMYQLNINDMGRRPLLDLLNEASWLTQIVQFINQIIIKYR